MKFRDSHAVLNNKLIFALYGPNWSLELDLGIPKDDQDLKFGIVCKGSVKPEDKEYALTWIHACADIVFERLDLEDLEEIHEVFEYALQEGLSQQDK